MTPEFLSFSWLSWPAFLIARFLVSFLYVQQYRTNTLAQDSQPKILGGNLEFGGGLGCV